MLPDPKVLGFGGLSLVLLRWVGLLGPGLDLGIVGPMGLSTMQTQNPGNVIIHDQSLDQILGSFTATRHLGTGTSKFLTAGTGGWIIIFQQQNWSILIPSHQLHGLDSQWMVQQQATCPTPRHIKQKRQTLWFVRGGDENWWKMQGVPHIQPFFIDIFSYLLKTDSNDSYILIDIQLYNLTTHESFI